MTAGGGYSQIRAADRDRDNTIGVLQAAYAEGRLTRDEYDVRAGHALTARTYGQLGALTADLPRPGGQLAAAPARQRTNPLALASLLCGIAEFFTFGFSAIPAIVLGHAARRQIRQTGDAGASMAACGLALGYVVIVPVALLAVILFVTLVHLML